MNIGEHLLEFHTRAAEDHIRLAKAWRAISACYARMEVEGAKDLAEAHEELANAHIDAADFHLSCCKHIAQETATIRDDNRFMPEKVGGVATSAVPRVCAPSIDKTVH